MAIAGFSVNRVAPVNLGLLAGLVLLVGQLAGCARPAPPAVGITAADDVYPPPGAGFFRDDAGLYDPVQRRLALAGAINETLGFHLALAAGSQTVPGLDLTPTQFRSGDAVIDASAVRIYRLHTVSIDHWPGWHIRLIEPRRRAVLVPDVVVPAGAPHGGLPVTLRPNESLPLWVDIRIPKGTAPGTYTGRLHLRSRRQTIDTIRISLTVWPFLLPDDPDLTLFTEVDHRPLAAHHVKYQGRPYAPERIFANGPRQAQLEALVTATCRLLQDHKLTPVLNRLYPVVKITASQDVTVEWTDYDRVVEGLLDGSAFADRRPPRVWPIPFDESFPPPPRHGAMESPTYSRTIRQYLAACAEHFREKGWLERGYVELPYADRPDRPAFDAARHFGRIAHDADPALQTLCNLFPQDMSVYGWPDFPHADLSREVDIWCPPAQFFDHSAVADAIEPARMWYRVDRPPFSGSVRIEAPPITTRVIPWQAYRLGVPAVALGVANDLHRDATDLTPQHCINRCPSTLVYPGSPFGLREPVASLRLKRLRRGMQDLAYVKLLETKGLSHIAATLAESLVPFAAADAYGAHFADGRPNAWIEDPYWWHIARRIMADELLHRIEEPASGPSLSIASSVQWRRFMEAARTLNIKVNGVHLRPAGRKPQDGAIIEVVLTLENHTRVPVGGVIRFGELPIGWTADPERIDVPEVAPGSARRLTLTARAAVVTWNENGIHYLPIVLDTPNRGTFHLAARFAYVPAQRLEHPIVIDGDLGDWPAGRGNVASDFVLITGEPPDPAAPRAARPAERTLCFVTRDRDALYFGFRCSREKAPDLRTRSNVVEYEDMIPVGAELVEVLIDPDRTPTRSPADLYHLVVKLSGALWERGVGTNPPTGRRRIWPADIRHAARWHGDRWEAEVRVPLDAFDRPIRRHQTWGINFTRFDAGRQEYANWAGAVANVYDPMALGNLGL